MNETKTIWIRPTLYCGASVLLACDGRCSHAWGLRRPRTELDPDEPDDYLAASDDEAGPCPFMGMDLGAEGCDTKPDSPADMNRWCARACERSVMVPVRGNTVTSIRLPDWSRPLRVAGATFGLSHEWARQIRKNGEAHLRAALGGE